MFSCEFCKISKNTYSNLILKVSTFYEKHWETLKKTPQPKLKQSHVKLLHSNFAWLLKNFYGITFYEKKSENRNQNKGAYIKYVGRGTGGFYKFFRKFFIAQETIDLNISWPSNLFRKYFMPLPSILVSYLRLPCSSISG